MLVSQVVRFEKYKTFHAAYMPGKSYAKKRKDNMHFVDKFIAGARDESFLDVLLIQVEERNERWLPR
jgi:hypothetical protein